MVERGFESCKRFLQQLFMLGKLEVVGSNPTAPTDKIPRGNLRDLQIKTFHLKDGYSKLYF